MITTRLLRNLSLLIAGWSFLTACATPAPASSPLTSPLPAPVQVAAAAVPPIATPASEAGNGGIMGRLVSGSSDGPGYFGGDLYLGTLIPASDPRVQPMISFSENVDLKAHVYQSDGRFAFSNVLPGDYALVVWNPVTSFVVEYFGGGGMVKVKVEAGKVIDLSTIVIP